MQEKDGLENQDVCTAYSIQQMGISVLISDVNKNAQAGKERNGEATGR